jgi:hypothetical protein
MSNECTGPKRVEIRRKVFVPLVIGSIIGVLFLGLIGWRMMRFIFTARSSYITRFGNQTAVQFPVTANAFSPDFISNIMESYETLYNDTIRTLIGGNLPLPEQSRFVLQFKYDRVSRELKTALWYDYWFVCNVCDSSPLYRANIVLDTITKDLKFHSIFFPGYISPQKYATFADQ